MAGFMAGWIIGADPLYRVLLFLSSKMAFEIRENSSVFDPFPMDAENTKFEYRNSKQIQMNKILNTKMEEPLCQFGFVLNFEHSDFDIRIWVMIYFFRKQDILPKSVTELSVTHWKGCAKCADCMGVMGKKAKIRCR